MFNSISLGGYVQNVIDNQIEVPTKPVKQMRIVVWNRYPFPAGFTIFGMPDYAALGSPLKTFTTPQVNCGTTYALTCNPTGVLNNFAVSWTGYYIATVQSDYTFQLLSNGKLSLAMHTNRC